MKIKAGFVFVHGAWHNKNAWNEITSRLSKQAYITRAVDLPGAGGNAQFPESFHKRPLDITAFATEPSPNAGVTQKERTNLVIDTVRELAPYCDGNVVLVGHSFGGLTVSQVAEAIPDEISTVVYLSAFLLPPDMPGIAIIQHPLMEEALVPSLFMADPETVGALRIDPASQDKEYLERLRQAFYGDVDSKGFEAARSHLHCDEPVQVALVPSAITPECFGRIPRHYIECTEDRAITISAQREMVKLVDKAMDSWTNVETLSTSHSPFYSQPEKLTDLLIQLVED